MFIISTGDTRGGFASVTTAKHIMSYFYQVQMGCQEQLIAPPVVRSSWRSVCVCVGGGVVNSGVRCLLEISE